MKLTIPELSLVALIGPSGAGKTTFARRHFKPTEILSSDHCRALVADDENEQAATRDAFEVLHFIAGKRLAAGRLTVIDATNVQPEARKPVAALARQHHCLAVAVVLNLPERLCLDRNSGRPDRSMGPHVVRRQSQDLRRSLRRLRDEGFRHVYVLSTPEEVEAAVVVRQPLWNNKKDEQGPFDIVGDVHGCLAELEALLERLGYVEEDGVLRHPEGRKAIFVGDLVDRGPDTPGVLRRVMAMVRAGTALCAPGNHDVKLLRKLRGRDVGVTHGLAESLAQLAQETAEFRAEVAEFIDSLVSHYVLDGGRLVVAHAGLAESLQGRGSAAVRAFALYGETTDETDEYGLPVRYNWAADYRGRAAVVYGHTPVLEPEWLNNTLCIDTGCVFGGRLTALRYPEREVVAVPAALVYYEPVRPPAAPAPAPLTAQQQADDLLAAEDVLGRRFVATRLRGPVKIREENAAPAFEVLSRFALNPKWLVYLPPTMSPTETSQREGLLEHPDEAFAYYCKRGVSRVLCEEKHMGSRAVAVVCRDEEAARRRFGLAGQDAGVVYTRTGRAFFSEDAALQRALLQRVRSAVEASGLWDELETGWLVLDCELMPWSAKAQELLRQQYAAVGAAGSASLSWSRGVLAQAAGRLPAAAPLLERHAARDEAVRSFVAAYRRYCWPVRSVSDLRLAPFHVLASEGRVHVDRGHDWHLGLSVRLAQADPEVLVATPARLVLLDDEASVREAVDWWDALTARGGEGMVVKPLDFVARDGKGLIQPALKCRGREYLRIIYGPESPLPENLERLRSRGLSAKRALALQEFALGIEALERFVAGEPLRRVHECVAGILALESEPVDPRL